MKKMQTQNFLLIGALVLLFALVATSLIYFNQQKQTYTGGTTTSVHSAADESTGE